jgi:hypothetical protein
MEVLVAGLVVAVVSFASGGFAIPIGFALGLQPLAVYVAACFGSMVGLVVFLYAGDKVRSRLLGGNEPQGVNTDTGIGRLIDRFGAKGLGLVGPVFPGVTASVVVGLSLGLSRSSLARWMTIGIAAMFALYTIGLWLLVELVGLE